MKYIKPLEPIYIGPKLCNPIDGVVPCSDEDAAGLTTGTFEDVTADFDAPAADTSSKKATPAA